MYTHPLFCFALLGVSETHPRIFVCFDLLCSALLCFALLCFAFLCFALLWLRFCFASLRFASLCSAVLCSALLCFALLCFALLCLCFALVKVETLIGVAPGSLMFLLDYWHQAGGMSGSFVAAAGGSLPKIGGELDQS